MALHDEVRYLESYISLQQIRLQDRGNIEFVTNVADESIQVAPMLFVVLLENAFKHGLEKMTSDAYIKMHLEATNAPYHFFH